LTDIEISNNDMPNEDDFEMQDREYPQDNNSREYSNIDFKIFKYILNNKNKMSTFQIQKFLKLLNYIKQNLNEPLSLHSISCYLKMKNNLKNKFDMLNNMKKVNVSDSIDAPIYFYYSDILQVLKKMYSNKKNKNKFALKFEKQIVNGERVYSLPQNCNWWEKMEEHAKTKFTDSVIAAVMLYSDQTTLSHDHRDKGWPVYMSLGNIDLRNRRKTHGHKMIALLPILEGEEYENLYKIKIFHRCMNILTEPLKNIIE
jgi:hypothetical protein